MAIKTVCTHCNQSYTLADDKEGKTVRCKGCGGAFVVRAPEALEEVDDAAEAIAAGAPPRAARSRQEDDDRPARRRPRDDRDDDEFRRPRRRRRGIPLWVWLGGAGFLLLVIVGVVLIILFQTGSIGPNRVTKENYDKLRVGMPESDVISLLGRPTREDDHNNRRMAEDFVKDLRGAKIDESNYLRTLIWEKEGNRIEVDVINRHVETPPRWISLPPPAAAGGGGQPPLIGGGPPTPPLTNDLAQRVMGKTPAEVIQILGQPTQKLGPQLLGGRGAQLSDDSWRWVQGSATLEIHFFQGKVTSWQGRNLR